MEEKLVLASGSPRRLELLRQAGIEPEVICADVAELTGGLAPKELAEQNARLKAAAVARRYPKRLVLGADTVVALGEEIFGKPKSPAEAVAMLTKLSGREHSVFTGVALACGEEIASRAAESRVRFRPLTAAEIADYVAGGEPLDKAGAYAVQGGAKGFVQSIEGDIDNIIGLPMRIVNELLADCKFGE